MTERFRSAWNLFWFEKRSRESLCLLRLFMGFVLFLMLTGCYGLWRINRLRMEFPDFWFSSPEFYFLDGGSRFPAPGFAWLPAPSFALYQSLIIVLFLLSILITVGLFTRYVAPLLALLLTYWFLLSEFFYSHHLFTFLLTFLVLGCSRCWERFSLDAYLAGNPSPPPRKIMPLRQLQIIVSIIYLFGTVFSKYNHGWFSGQFMESMQETGMLTGVLAPPLLSAVPLQFFSIATVVIETSLIFALWIPRWRRVAIFAGVLLHLGIDVMMDAGTFSYQMMVLYIAFITPEAKATTICFNEQNPRSQRLRRWLNLFDWLRRFSWQPLNQSEAAKFHVQLADGRTFEGWHAWREILVRIPLTFIPAMTLSIPCYLAACCTTKSLNPWNAPHR
jgi:hypothetical protein